MNFDSITRAFLVGLFIAIAFGIWHVADLLQSIPEGEIRCIVIMGVNHDYNGQGDL